MSFYVQRSIINIVSPSKLSPVLLFSVCILMQARPFSKRTPVVKDTFMEVSESHLENMFYSYICTESSSIHNVSP